MISRVPKSVVLITSVFLIFGFFVYFVLFGKKRFSNEKRLKERNFDRTESNNEEIFSELNNIIVEKSNFGKEEYQCFGSCFCEKHDRRTATSGKSVISTFLFSISIALAYQKAKTYFDSKCEERLSEECHQSFIKSSIEKCAIDFKSDEKDDSNEKNEDRRVFFCFGNCLKNTKLVKESSKKQFQYMICVKLKQEGEIVVYETEASKVEDSKKYERVAQHKFYQNYLIDFCKEKSKMDIVWEGATENGENKVRNRVMSGCVGRKSQQLKNVNCRQIDPEPTNFSLKSLIKFNRKKAVFDRI